MFLVRTPPTTLPFEMAGLKLHCRVDAEEIRDDVILDMYAWAAIKAGEFSSNRVWVESDWTGEIDAFPRGTMPIVIPKSPCTAVSGISYVDAGGVDQVLDTSAYRFLPSSLESDGGRPYASIEPVTEWPSGTTVKVSFSAGWSKDIFPKELVQWTFVKVSSHYEQREDLASATRKIAIAFPRHFVDSLLDRFYLPRY